MRLPRRCPLLWVAVISCIGLCVHTERDPAVISPWSAATDRHRLAVLHCPGVVRARPVMVLWSMPVYVPSGLVPQAHRRSHPCAHVFILQKCWTIQLRAVEYVIPVIHRPQHRFLRWVWSVCQHSRPSARLGQWQAMKTIFAQGSKSQAPLQFCMPSPGSGSDLGRSRRSH